MNESTYTILFLDTETTGNAKEDRICQLSFKRPGEPTNTMFDELYKPPTPIQIEAMAIHHITNEMVDNSPLFTESPQFIELKSLFENPKTIIVAHNARFDIDMIKKEGIFPSNFIDTLKISRALDPNGLLPRHNLQYLRYKLGLYKLITDTISPHDAKSDVIVLELLFNRLYEKIKSMKNFTADDALIEMLRISSEPTLIQKITFGKYKDSLISDLAKSDPGYLEWLLKEKRKTPDEEEDWIYTLTYHLEGKEKAKSLFKVDEQNMYAHPNRHIPSPKSQELKQEYIKPIHQIDQFIEPISGLTANQEGTINHDDDFDDEDDGETVAYDEYNPELDTIEF